MNLTKIIAIVSIIFSPLVGIGLALDDFYYWITLDILMMIFYPLVGIKLLMINKKYNAK